MAVTREIAERQRKADQTFKQSGKPTYSAYLTGHGKTDLDNNAGLVVRRHTAYGSSTLQMVFRNDVPGQEATFADAVAISNHQDGEIRAFLETMVHLASLYGITAEGNVQEAAVEEEPLQATVHGETYTFSGVIEELLGDDPLIKRSKAMLEEKKKALFTPEETMQIKKVVQEYLDDVKTRGPIYGSFDHLMKGSDVA